MWSWNCLQQTRLIVYTVRGNQTVKTTYTATTTMCFFHQFHSSVQLVTLALGWLRLIGDQYVFALKGLLAELKTTWWDCFCMCFGCISKEPCMITVAPLYHIPSKFIHDWLKNSRLYFQRNNALLFSHIFSAHRSDQIWYPKADSGDRTGVTKSLYLAKRQA